MVELKTTVRETLDEEWRRLGAIEAVLAEVGREFEGEDLAPAPLRHLLDHGREKLGADARPAR